MSEKRTILAHINKSIAGKAEIAFPDVRAWIVEPGKVATGPFSEEFPESGTVYLHAYSANDTLPLPDHYGIFDCQPSERTDTKTWQVVATDETISQVLLVASALEKSLDFYAEVNAIKIGRLANTFCGRGHLYLLTQDGWIVGPYSWNEDVLTAASERTMRWCKDATELLYAGEGDLAFISARSLGTGIAFPPTLQDATRRILRLVAKNGRCGFLSRQHISDLAQEMTEAPIVDELSWFVGTMNELLPVLKDTLEASDVLCQELLGNPAIGDLLEARWRDAHSQKVGQEEEKLQATTDQLTQTTAQQKKLLETTKNLGRKSDELRVFIADQSEAAQSVFNAEIARLAADPSKIAILSALLTKQSSPEQQQPSVPALWAEMVVPNTNSTCPNGEVMIRSLIASGLSTRCAHEVATAALAAFLSGQVLSINSPLAGLLAEAILSGSGHSSYWACEVPAGLLEAIPSPSAASEKLGIVFHGANRSDYSLVIAGIRSTFLKQLVGAVTPSIDVVFTLDATETVVFEQPLPTGPCLTGDFLTFSEPQSDFSVRALPSCDSVVIPAIKPHELEEMFPGTFPNIGVFKSSFLIVMARRYCAALKSAGCDSARIKEMFLKFWLLPRFTREETVELLKTEDALCKSDAQFAARLASCLDE